MVADMMNAAVIGILPSLMYTHACQSPTRKKEYTHDPMEKPDIVMLMA